MSFNLLHSNYKTSQSAALQHQVFSTLYFCVSQKTFYEVCFEKVVIFK